MSQAGFQILSRRLDADPNAMSLFQACEPLSDSEHRLLLESSEAGSNGKQQSILFLESALILEARGFEVTVMAKTENGQQALDVLSATLNAQQTSEISVQVISNELLKISYLDSRILAEEELRKKRLTSLDAVRKVLSVLATGSGMDAEKLIAAGVVGYDYVNVLEQLPDMPTTEEDFPDYILLIADSQIMLDKQSKRAEIRQIIFNGPNAERIKGRARGRIAKLEAIIKSTKGAFKLPDNRQVDIDFDKIAAQPSRDDFKDQIGQLKEAIDEGRIFQAVVSRKFSLDCDNPELAYQVLTQQNPSPYQFYLRLGKYTLFGASPESSLRFDSKSRTISIMPIAGTRGRGRNPDGSINLELDSRLEVDLKLDEKELAEHLMLVDLARNDLARIAVTGSRHVSELLAIYRYASVMHMVSRVDAQLADDLDVYHACQSCFHMGTLSGAPKAEAMALISEIEKKPRGAYGGAVGYFTAAGDMDTAIVIRSALMQADKAVITAGAGVVYDSDPDMEVQETELKASSVIRAIQVAKQLAQGPGE